MAKPSAQDAMLMLQLAQWGAAVELNKASNWMWSDEFIPEYEEFAKKYPLGSQGNEYATTVCSYFETLGTLYKYGLINEDLLFDWLAVSMVWERIKGYALGVRQLSGNPRIYENFEAMAKANAEYDARQAG